MGLIACILLTSVWCIGLSIASGEGMIFEKVGKYANERFELGNKIWNPILSCVVCMPSIHSIFGISGAYLIGYVNLDLKILLIYPFCVCGATALNALYFGVINFINGNNKGDSGGSLEGS